MTPAHMHIKVQVLSSEGLWPSVTVTAPGVHGAVVTGMHGIGVSTPNAADVADATAGLARLMHMPNGMMLIIGLKSMIVAAGWLLVFTRSSGSTVSVDGAMPKLH
jgi:hypothetical protein